MAVLMVIFAFLVLAGIVFISIKISNLKARATQHILKNTGISSSELGSQYDNQMSQINLKRFLNDHPNYTEESFNQLANQYINSILQRYPRSEFEPYVCEKMQKDQKIDQIKAMQIKRINLESYMGKAMTICAVYSDNRDEYLLDLLCRIEDNTIFVREYHIRRGRMIGF